MIDTLYLVLGGALAVLGAVWSIFRSGKKSGAAEHQRQTHAEERKANEANIKANNAANSATDDDNRDWLLNNAQRKRNDTD